MSPSSTRSAIIRASSGCGSPACKCPRCPDSGAARAGIDVVGAGAQTAKAAARPACISQARTPGTDAEAAVVSGSPRRRGPWTGSDDYARGPFGESEHRRQCSGHRQPAEDPRPRSRIPPPVRIPAVPAIRGASAFRSSSPTKLAPPCPVPPTGMLAAPRRLGDDRIVQFGLSRQACGARAAATRTSRCGSSSRVASVATCSTEGCSNSDRAASCRNSLRTAQQFRRERLHQSMGSIASSVRARGRDCRLWIEGESDQQLSTGSLRSAPSRCTATSRSITPCGDRVGREPAGIIDHFALMQWALRLRRGQPDFCRSLGPIDRSRAPAMTAYPPDSLNTPTASMARSSRRRDVLEARQPLQPDLPERSRSSNEDRRLNTSDSRSPPAGHHPASSAAASATSSSIIAAAIVSRTVGFFDSGQCLPQAAGNWSSPLEPRRCALRNRLRLLASQVLLRSFSACCHRVCHSGGSAYSVAWTGECRVVIHHAVQLEADRRVPVRTRPQAADRPSPQSRYRRLREIRPTMSYSSLIRPSAQYCSARELYWSEESVDRPIRRV